VRAALDENRESNRLCGSFSVLVWYNVVCGVSWFKICKAKCATFNVVAKVTRQFRFLAKSVISLVWRWRFVVIVQKRTLLFICPFSVVFAAVAEVTLQSKVQVEIATSTSTNGGRLKVIWCVRIMIAISPVSRGTLHFVGFLGSIYVW
jgi:hypothetical protein